jgi:hypothetical protein
MTFGRVDLFHQTGLTFGYGVRGGVEQTADARRSRPGYGLTFCRVRGARLVREAASFHSTPPSNASQVSVQVVIRVFRAPRHRIQGPVSNSVGFTVRFSVSSSAVSSRISRFPRRPVPPGVSVRGLDPVRSASREITRAFATVRPQTLCNSTDARHHDGTPGNQSVNHQDQTGSIRLNQSGRSAGLTAGFKRR